MRNKRRLLSRIQALILCAAMLLIYIMPVQNVFAEGDGIDQSENTDLGLGLQLSYKLKGTTEFIDLVEPYEIEDSSQIETFHAIYTFALADNEAADGSHERTMNSGDYYFINLPEHLDIGAPVDGAIKTVDDRTIANYTFVQVDGRWQVRVEFADMVDDLNEYDIAGSMEFDFSLDLSEVLEGSSTTVSIPINSTESIDIDITKPVPPATVPTSLEKTASSYNDQTRELVWNVEMMPAIGIFSGCVFKDTIDINNLDLVSIKHGSETLIEGVDYTFDALTGEIVYTIPTGRDGVDYQDIEITTQVKRSVYGNLTATTINNVANLSGGDSFVDFDSNTATEVITPNWLEKSGEIIDGNSIQWTIEANSTNQAMYNAVITDVFPKGLILDKTSVEVGGVAISVYDDTHTPADATEVYGIYTTIGDGTTELNIYLPRDVVNVSNETQTITLITDVVSPDDATTIAPEYSNSATLNGNYVTDDEGVGTLPGVGVGPIPVAVPNLSIEKGHSVLTAADKRDGTITWTIAAVSNLLDYGKSIITDTLPADQTYVEDEIYWVEGGLSLNAGTEPSAVIGGDGRTLTITFNSTNKALATQQNFTVKTKIDPEIYGENINQDFDNAVSGTLMSKDLVTTLATDTDTDSVTIINDVVTKVSSAYNENTTKQGQNPRVNFTITINQNLMPLEDVIITDDLDDIMTEFKKSGESVYKAVDNVTWTLVAGTLTIEKAAGTTDLAAVAEGANTNALYDSGENQITVDFGTDVSVNDSYTIKFTAELDVAQDEIFKENGTIRCKGNVADIVATGLKTGTISSPATPASDEIKNEVLGKSGVNLVDEQQVLWTINLNQHRVMLDSATVVDVLPEGLTLDPTSIKLYYDVIGTDGNFVTGANVESQGTLVEPCPYTYGPATGEGMEGRYQITVVLPDSSTDYILRFATDISDSLLGTTISNSAHYVGQEANTDNSNTSIMSLSSSVGGSSTTKTSVLVEKRSKDNGELVGGASFELNWLRNGDVDDPVYVRTLTASSGSVTFYGLTIGEIYTVTEVAQPDGFLLDSSDPITVVELGDGSGNMAPITFANTPIKTGSWEPIAIKKLDGKDIVPDHFSFELKDATDVVMTNTTPVELSDGDYSYGFVMSSGVDSEGIQTFTNDHTFLDSDAEGLEVLVATKNFYMSEVDAGLSGYEYDSQIYTLKVEVYNVKGQDDLKVVIKDGSDNIISDNAGNLTELGTPIFSNTYRANGSMVLGAKKILVGHVLAANQFEFELYEGTTLLQTISNGEGVLDGTNSYTNSFAFEAIEYTQADVGTKTYKIIEKDTGVWGYSYDLSEYNVTVLIEDTDDGNLTSSVQSIQKVEGTITTELGSDLNNISFTNIYINAHAILKAQKQIQGRVLEDQQFSFVLNQVSDTGEFIQEVQIAKNNIDGTVDFEDLIYTLADIDETYYYTISELQEDKPGYSYDSTVYDVSVNIVDNGDGTITANVNYLNNTAPVLLAEFNNNYITTDTSVQIAAEKELIGHKLVDGQFKASLTLISNGLQPDLLIEETTNAEDGSILFAPITYTQEDMGKTFTYMVKEINDGQLGYVYDDAIYKVTVEVIDNGDGTLSTSVLMEEGSEGINTEVSNITFVNKYLSDPATGDDSPLFLYTLIMSLSILVSGAVLILLKKMRIRNN